MKEVKKAAGFAVYHGMILLRGIAKMLYGAMMAAVIALIAEGFASVPTEGGYAAVSDFIFAVSLTVIALAGLYLFGCRKRGRG